MLYKRSDLLVWYVKEECKGPVCRFFSPGGLATYGPTDGLNAGIESELVFKA